MKEGLLWYDPNPHKALAAIVAEAAQAYHRKFGQRPDTCYVHPPAPAKAIATAAGPIRLLDAPTVQLHHFWIGREENP